MSQQGCVKELSQKILAGWILLNESCPDCNVPLVQAKTGHPILCVSCKSSFTKTSEGRCQKVDETSQNSNGSTSSPLGVSSESNSAPLTTSALNSSWSNTNSSSTPTSSSSGAASAPPPRVITTVSTTTTTAANSAKVETTSPAITVTSQVDSSSSAAALPTTATSTNNAAAKPQPSSSSSSFNFSSYETKRDDNSAEMGKLLLRGYCMTGSVCPEGCPVPLMREPKTRELYCVSCQKWFVSEADVNSATAGRKTSATATATTTATTTATASSSSSERRASGSQAVTVPPQQPSPKPQQPKNAKPTSSNVPAIKKPATANTPPSQDVPTSSYIEGLRAQSSLPDSYSAISTAGSLAPELSPSHRLQSDADSGRTDSTVYSHSREPDELTEYPETLDPDTKILDERGILPYTLQSLLDHMDVLRTELSHTQSTSDADRICSYIRNCAKAMKSVQHLTR